MHKSALDKFKVFVDVYLSEYGTTSLCVLDVGSKSIGGGVAGTHRPEIIARGWSYVGMDIEAGDNVDLVVKDGYDWREIEASSFDVVLCSQVLEHTRYPWKAVQEIARVLRPRGLAFLIAPSAGHVHRYPEDCFRYYPDGLPALASSSGLNVVDAHVQSRLVYRSNIWLDAMVVIQKPDGPNPSQISEARSLHAFAARDEALAKQRDPIRRLRNVRNHISMALKALTRRI